MLANIGLLKKKHSILTILIGGLFLTFAVYACSDKSLSTVDDQANLNNKATGTNIEGGGIK